MRDWTEQQTEERRAREASEREDMAAYWAYLKRVRSSITELRSSFCAMQGVVIGAVEREAFEEVPCQCGHGALHQSAENRLLNDTTINVTKINTTTSWIGQKNHTESDGHIFRTRLSRGKLSMSLSSAG